jgi:hypothetical protein
LGTNITQINEKQIGFYPSIKTVSFKSSNLYKKIEIHKKVKTRWNQKNVVQKTKDFN